MKTVTIIFEKNKRSNNNLRQRLKSGRLSPSKWLCPAELNKFFSIGVAKKIEIVATDFDPKDKDGYHVRRIGSAARDTWNNELHLHCRGRWFHTSAVNAICKLAARLMPREFWIVVYVYD